MTRKLTVVLPVFLAFTLLTVSAWGLSSAAGSKPRAANPAAKPSGPAVADAAATASAITQMAQDQSNSALAYNPQTGEFLAVWQHAYSGADHDIYARRVAADGSPLGSEIPIATSTDFQSRPTVAYNAVSGQYLVLWEHHYSLDNHDVYARLLDSSGTPQGAEFPIATATAFEGEIAVSVSAASGDYLVVWHHLPLGSEDGAIHGRRLTAAGTLTGTEIIVASTAGDEALPTIVYGATQGQYLVAWQLDNPENGTFDIEGQFVGEDGSLGVGRFPIAAGTGGQFAPAVAYNSDWDEFLVTWQNEDRSVLPTRYAILARRLDPDGTLVDGPIPVSGEGPNGRLAPAIAYGAATHEYYIIWEHEYSVDDHDIYARRVAADGTLPAAVSAISQLTTYERQPAVAPAAQPSYLLIWQDERNQTTTGADIYGTSVSLLSDLVLETLTFSDNPIRPGETVNISATVRNAGPLSFAGAILQLAANRATFYESTLPTLAAGQTHIVATTFSYSETGALEIRATVDPDAVLPEITKANNTLTRTLDLVFEVNPPWSRPDLLLRDLSWSPRRPGPGDPVSFHVTVENASLNAVSATFASLVVGLDEVAAVPVPALGPGASTALTLTWGAAQPGRHPIAVRADAAESVFERDEANNQLFDYIRVAGQENPLPDLEATLLDPSIPNLAVGDSVSLTLEIRNEGFADALDLPVAVSLDGVVVVATDIPVLTAGEGATIHVPWERVTQGHHYLAVELDPDDDIADDSLQGTWVEEIIVPGLENHYTSPTSLSGQWQLAGPESIDGGAYVGRIDAIDISSQEHNKIVLGATQGGIWMSGDGGGRWRPLTDHLPAPDFVSVRFDPRDDSIIYGGTGTMWAGRRQGLGVFKSIDHGATWTNFAGPWLGTGISEILPTYIDPPTMTLFVSTDLGVFRWTGSPTATRTVQSEWDTVWTQPTPGADRRVTDMLITAENPPMLYWAAFRDAVYRVDATAPLANTPISLTAGFTSMPNVIMLGNSPADPGRVYASVKRLDGSLAVYRRFHSGSWTFMGVAPEKCEAFNQFMGVHPENADIVFIGAVKGCRSTAGGSAWHFIPSTVHDDYKAIAFDPDNADVVFFVTDGGVYRCTGSAATLSCAGLNQHLATTMPFDVELDPSVRQRMIAGTQDNGTIRGTSGSDWTFLHVPGAGDGRYSLVDPTDTLTMYVQFQTVDEVYKSTDGGTKFELANTGLPVRSFGDPFMTMDPEDARTLLIADDQVYRTVDGGAYWQGIGPALPAGVVVLRIAVDPLYDAYFVGTSNGEVWVTFENSVGPDAWSKIFTRLPRAAVRNLLVDPDDPDILYVGFENGGPDSVIRLTRTSTTRDPWTPQSIAAGLDADRVQNGGYNNTVRGLIKHPAAEILYLGTDRGVYQGAFDPAAGAWDWQADTCGLPLTYVSDLTLHPDQSYMVAATFGRSIYTRTVHLYNPPPDPYDTGTRNDTLATAATVPTVTHNIILPGGQIANLNFDSLVDKDFFRIPLPPKPSADCLEADDPRLAEPGVRQCRFSALVNAPDTPDPFQINLHRPDGSVIESVAANSQMGIILDRPWDTYPGGEILISVSSPTGCRSRYQINLRYHNWYGPPLDFPGVDYDIDWYIPDVARFNWVLPADPIAQTTGFLGRQEPPPEQRLLFYWDNTQDFQVRFDVSGFGGFNATLYDDQGNIMAPAAPASLSASSSGIDIPDLPAGWYALGFGEGVFPTYFQGAFCPANAPTGLVATISAEDVTLAWAADGATGSYDIHRSPTPYFAPASANRIATVPEGTLSYPDPGILTSVPNHVYYRVFAVNCDRAETGSSREIGIFQYALEAGN